MSHLREANRHMFVPSEEGRAAYPLRFADRVASSDALWLVAEVEDQPGLIVAMGEVHLTPDPGRVPALAAKINDVWVDPAHRRRGLAAAIAETLLMWAHSRGVEAVWLDWVVGNDEADGLWRAMGFQPVSVMATLGIGGEDGEGGDVLSG